jgi:hypothetical protein
MSLFDRKSKKISYSITSTCKLSFIICPLLIVYGSFTHWFFRGAVLDSAKQEYDNGCKQGIAWVCLLAVGAGLTGLKITDRTDDRDP